jgi:hypothetical protein
VTASADGAEAIHPAPEVTATVSPLSRQLHHCSSFIVVMLTTVVFIASFVPKARERSFLSSETVICYSWSLTASHRALISLAVTVLEHGGSNLYGGAG